VNREANNSKEMEKFAYRVAKTQSEDSHEEEIENRDETEERFGE
jgi:hypothetical protein